MRASNSGKSTMESWPKKTFTVQEANAMLPLVRAIALDISALAQDVMERRERLGHLLAGREIDGRDPYEAELIHTRDELERDAERLQGFVDELRHLGVEPKSGLEGLVDFPSIREGRLIYLCWKLGEAEVMFWHDLEAGFRGRQPIERALRPGAAAASEAAGRLAHRGVGSPAASPHESQGGEDQESPLQHTRGPVKFEFGQNPSDS